MLGSGQLDAGFAALAGFVAAALAVRYLTPEQLGVYALLYMAFGVASQVPTQLILSPAEVILANRPVSQRLGSLRWSVPRGTLVALVASLLVAGGALPVANGVDLGDLVPLVVTAVTFTLISPIQDHIRRVMHAANQSWAAAMVSATNLVTTGIAAFLLFQVDPLWVPFGCMTAGNVISSCLALYYMRGSDSSESPPTGELVAIGRYLLVVGLSDSGGHYLAGTVVVAIAGPAMLGYAEAARLVARPSEVSARGILAAVGPRLLVASANRDGPAARRLSRTHHRAVVAVWAVYALAVTTPIGWGIPRGLFPTAYDIEWLVLAILLAQLATAFTLPLQTRLMGMRQQVSLAVTELMAQGGRLTASASAIWLGAFAIPIGDAVASGIKVLGYRRRLHRLEQQQSEEGPV